MSFKTGMYRARLRLNQAIQEFRDEISSRSTSGGASGDVIVNGYITSEAKRIVDKMEWDDDYRHDYVDEMLDTDSIIKSTLNVLQLPIKQADVWVEAASSDNIDLQYADLVSNDLLNNPHFTWAELLNDLLTFLPYGFCIFWKEMERVDQRWRWKRFALRRQGTLDRWDISSAGHLLRVHQQAIAYDGTTIDQWLPNERPKSSVDHPLAHFAYDQTGDLFRGKSVFRTSWRPYALKREAIFNMATQIVRASNGLPHIEYSSNMPALNSTERNDIQEVMRRVHTGQQNHLESTSRHKINVYGGKELFGFDLTGYMHYFDQQIVASVLATFLEQPKLTVGSRAMQSSNIAFFLANLESIANNNIENVFNNGFRGTQHIKQYMQKNFADATSSRFAFPKLRISKIDQLNISEFAKILRSLVTAGMPILPEDWNIVRKKLRFREAEIDELKEFTDAKTAEAEAKRSTDGFAYAKQAYGHRTMAGRWA